MNYVGNVILCTLESQHRDCSSEWLVFNFSKKLREMARSYYPFLLKFVCVVAIVTVGHSVSSK